MVHETDQFTLVQPVGLKENRSVNAAYRYTIVAGYYKFFSSIC